MHIQLEIFHFQKFGMSRKSIEKIGQSLHSGVQIDLKTNLGVISSNLALLHWSAS
jgi:hypothetical protein